MTKRKPKPEIVMVTHSCGCVFCDLGLAPNVVDGRHFHYIHRDNARIECSLKTAERKD